ncbi:MAG: hypothetical protein OXF79_21580 [Chloroflexi bacterium]|nr:hypothetical protein [Chloroflexota bacterium]
MSFSCADNERYTDSLVALAEGKYDALVAAYADKSFENESARVFASQGFPRRLELMKQCILGSMEPFPRRISWVPSPFGILDAVIHLQAFVVNVRGPIDNLGHVWVREKGLTGEDGAPLADSQVRFAPGYKAVLDSISPEFAGYLKELGPWFEYLARFGHALEHHAALYVPGNTVSQETLRTFEEMGERIGNAELRGDDEEADRLTRKRSALVSFFPIMECAFGDDAKKGVIQFQMMTDFETVVGIGQRLLLEFD